MCHQDGRGVWGRMGACIYMTESLGRSPETITTLLTSYTSIQNKNLKKIKKASSTWKDLENFMISEISHIET